MHHPTQASSRSTSLAKVAHAPLARRNAATQIDCRAAIEDLLGHPKFVETHYQLHHGGRKSDHLQRSARYAHWLARVSGADRGVCARAGLLHDLHSRLGTLSTHGAIAASVAAQMGEGPDVCRAIVSHMFPLGPAPTTREGWVLAVADKLATLVDALQYAARFASGEGIRLHRTLRQTDPFLRQRSRGSSLAPAA